MLKKIFSKYDETVSLLGYGCWGIGKSLWLGAEDSESKKSLHKAIEKGVNIFDSALVYGDGHSEKLVGEVEKESEQKIFITSKIPSKKYEWPAKDDSKFEDSFPTEHIIKCTEQSLRNMKREYIDLQQFHVWNDNWADIDEWKEAIYRLKKDGKVKYFGISINDHQPENGIEAGKTGLIDCFQVIFNIFDQSPINKLFPFCKENNISILARVPLDEGGLTGKINKETIFKEGDFRARYFKKDRKQQVEEKANNIWLDVKDESDSLVEAALRFVISFDEVTSVIPGMRTENHLLSNVETINKGSLSKELINKLKEHKWERNFYK